MFLPNSYRYVLSLLIFWCVCVFFFVFFCFFFFCCCFFFIVYTLTHICYSYTLCDDMNCFPANCLADHGQTIQSLDKFGSCHCIFRLLQTFLPLFSWKMIVNLNNQSGSQYLTEWLWIYFSDEIVRFFYCKTNHRSQQPHKSANKIICAIISACYFALK